MVIRSFWGRLRKAEKELSEISLNPSVVIRSFWGRPIWRNLRCIASLNPSVVIRSFWGKGRARILLGACRCLNPSVVIRSFWGEQECLRAQSSDLSQSLRGDQVFLGHQSGRQRPSHFLQCLNPSVVIRSFWGVSECDSSVKIFLKVSIPPW